VAGVAKLNMSAIAPVISIITKAIKVLRRDFQVGMGGISPHLAICDYPPEKVK
jgi:hypothetical protein